MFKWLFFELVKRRTVFWSCRKRNRKRIQWIRVIKVYQLFSTFVILIYILYHWKLLKVFSIFLKWFNLSLALKIIKKYFQSLLFHFKILFPCFDKRRWKRCLCAKLIVKRWRQILNLNIELEKDNKILCILL